MSEYITKLQRAIKKHYDIGIKIDIRNPKLTAECILGVWERAIGGRVNLCSWSRLPEELISVLQDLGWYKEGRYIYHSDSRRKITWEQAESRMKKERKEYSEAAKALFLKDKSEDISLKVLRKRLNKYWQTATKDERGEEPGLFRDIEVVAEGEDIERRGSSTNCISFVFAEYYWLNPREVKDRLTHEVEIPERGNIVAYYSGDELRHLGIYIKKISYIPERHLVMSRWRVGPVFVHPQDHVPESYGDRVKYYKNEDPEFWKFLYNNCFLKTSDWEKLVHYLKTKPFPFESVLDHFIFENEEIMNLMMDLRMDKKLPELKNFAKGRERRPTNPMLLYSRAMVELYEKFGLFGFIDADEMLSYIFSRKY